MIFPPAMIVDPAAEVPDTKVHKVHKAPGGDPWV